MALGDHTSNINKKWTIVSVHMQYLFGEVASKIRVVEDFKTEIQGKTETDGMCWGEFSKLEAAL